VTAKREPLATTATVCAGAAVLAAAGGLALGAWRPGLALALGLLAGAANGFLARGALGLDTSFRATSLGRLLALSAAGVGLGALLGVQYVPLVLIGVAAAQLVLAVVAAVAAVRT
jgi:hypothetical protein